MNDFNIGDKVRVKKLSKLEFKDIYYKKHKFNPNWDYGNYLNYHIGYFNKIFEIIVIDKDIIYFENHNIGFYKEEIEKVNYLKTKYKIIKELLKNE